MSDIGSDFDAAYEMVCKAQDRLAKRDKGHELVSFLFIESKTESERQWQKLLRRFSKYPDREGNVRGDMELTYALAKYLIALEVALGERPASTSSDPDWNPEWDDIPF